jgi:uncharacterized protein YcbK (DUF882 family)
VRRARQHINASLAAFLRGAGIVVASSGAFGVAICSAWVGNVATMKAERVPRAGSAGDGSKPEKASRPNVFVDANKTEESLKAVNYSDMVRRWHRLPSRPPETTPNGRPMLVLEMIHTNERVLLAPMRDDGGFTDEDLERASYALRDPGTDDRCAIDGRVLDLAYRLETHFTSRALRIVSAFRASSPRSNHGKGRALDLVVPGAADQDVAHYAETLGFVGVGLYPVSGFIHVDSRARSYFWLDRSGPGQHTRAVPVLPLLAQASDRRALARGETPPDKPGGVVVAEDQTTAEAQVKESPNSQRLTE